MVTDDTEQFLPSINQGIPLRIKLVIFEHQQPQTNVIIKIVIMIKI